MVAHSREALHVRNETEVGRVTAELADQFAVSPDTIEYAVRKAFDSRSKRPVPGLVPAFVERSIRRALRDIDN